MTIHTGVRVHEATYMDRGCVRLTWSEGALRVHDPTDME